ncbi:MAG TPA: hypothetical protein VFH42_05725, partial [Sporolactobacillaceae bacterium]|nr:hypothetical protein [Sporolactobacillaceae bacterium]
ASGVTTTFGGVLSLLMRVSKKGHRQFKSLGSRGLVFQLRAPPKKHYAKGQVKATWGIMMIMHQ